MWGCDAAQRDISQALALAVVALIAVMPEYAVDMYFTWQAGQNPDSDYAHYAIANMTGANRLIIGVAWALVAILFWFKARRPVLLSRERMLEVRFLWAATAYAFVIPIKGSLVWYDGIVFIALYAWYVVLAGRRPTEEAEAEGPGAYLSQLPTVARRLATAGLFVFAAGAVLTNAERFCEGLVGTGKMLHINEFLLVQWLAPLASEAPEFVVAVMFALRAKPGMALGSLLSAKLNQWTLLVGMIPGVFAVSHGSLEHPLPMDHVQLQEVLLTAAQSLLAVALVAALRLSVGQGLLLFGLFAGQLLAPQLVEMLPGGQAFGMHGEQMHPLFTLLYLASAAVVILERPKRLAALWPWRRIGTEICDHCGRPLALGASAGHDDECGDGASAVDASHNSAASGATA